MSQAKNKISRAGLFAAYMTVGILVLAILLNLLVGMLPAGITKINVTGEDTFKLSQQTKKYLDRLEEDVTLYFISEGGASGTENEIYLFLSQFAERSDRITLEVIDPATSPEFIVPYGGQWPENMSIIAQSQRRYKLVSNSDLYYYYNATLGMNMTPMEYEYYCQSFMELMQSNPSYQESYLSFVSQTQPMFDGNSGITNAINYVLLERIPKVYVRASSSTGAGLGYDLLSRLDLSGYLVETLSTVQSIPKDCDLLILHALAKDLNGAEASAVRTYLNERSGKLLVTTDIMAGALPNLESVLNDFGMSYPESMDVICEGAGAYMVTNPSTSQAYPYYMIMHMADHAAAGGFTGKFVAPTAHAIKLTPTDGVTQTSWLYTSEKAYPLKVTDAEKGTTEKGAEGTYTIGAVAERGDDRVIWIACSVALTDDGNQMSSGNNYSLTCGAISWLTDSNNQGVAIEASAISAGTLSVSPVGLFLWGGITILVLPATFLIVGIVIRQRRKRR